MPQGLLLLTRIFNHLGVVAAERIGGCNSHLQIRWLEKCEYLRLSIDLLIDNLHDGLNNTPGLVEQSAPLPGGTYIEELYRMGIIKLLLVDDHELVRTGIRHILEEASDIEVIGEASSGDEALKNARKLEPDVVLMDVNMPGMGGIEATRRMVRLLPEVRVIALTVLDDDPFPARLNEAGARGYLTKGCPAEEMLDAIRTVHAGQRYVASAVARKHMLADLSGVSSTPFSELSSREMQVCMMILQGQRTQDISEALSLSPKTVSTYRQRIYEKLTVKNDVELTRLAYRFHLIEDAGE